MRPPPDTLDSSPWMPFETRKRARDEKRVALLRTAVRLFLEEGYHRTPLSKVAERLNITKMALYNYFGSKEEILAELFRLGSEQYEAGFAAVERMQGDGLTKLRHLIRAYVVIVTADFGMCFARIDDRELSEETRLAVRHAKRRYDSAFRTLIREGVEDGSIRPCEPKLAAFIIIGALNGVADWYRADGPLSVETLADEFALRLTEGYAMPQPQRARA